MQGADGPGGQDLFCGVLEHCPNVLVFKKSNPQWKPHYSGQSFLQQRKIYI